MYVPYAFHSSLILICLVIVEETVHFSPFAGTWNVIKSQMSKSYSWKKIACSVSSLLVRTMAERIFSVLKFLISHNDSSGAFLRRFSESRSTRAILVANSSPMKTLCLAIIWTTVSVSISPDASIKSLGSMAYGQMLADFAMSRRRLISCCDRSCSSRILFAFKNSLMSVNSANL